MVRLPVTSSLSLMGIKSRFLRRIAAQASGRLITPHGDRKQPISPDAQTSSDILITPHGDRKPRSGILA